MKSHARIVIVGFGTEGSEVRILSPRPLHTDRPSIDGHRRLEVSLFVISQSCLSDPK